MRQSPWWVHPALLTAGLLYGANYSIAKDAMTNYLEPFGLNLLRVLTAVIVFWIVGSFNNEKIDKEDFPRLILCALCGASINISFFFFGLSLTSAVNASLILTTSPIIVLIVSRVLLKEAIGTNKTMGIIIGLLGAVYLINTNDISFSNDSFLGDIIVFLNVVLYSSYLVLVKPLMLKYQPITVLKWIFGMGLLIVFPLGYDQLFSISLDNIESVGYLSLIYVATATTVFAYYLNVKAITHVSSSIVGYYAYLQPLFAGFIEIISGREAITSEILISTSLIFLGVFLVSRAVQ